MQNPFRLAAYLMVIVAVGAWWLWPGATRTPDSDAQKRESAPAAPKTIPAPEQLTDDQTPDTNSDVTEPAVDANERAASTTAPNPRKPFRVDSTGKLIVDEQTRLNIEALFAQTDRDQLPEIQQEITQTLPAAAAAEAVGLLERYDNYSKAQRQAYPPGVAPATEEAALAELEGLHALRVAHFGPETAQAFYGNDEKVARSLIQLMRVEKDQGLTMEEKAARAQQLYDSAPELRESDNSSRSR